MNKGEAGLVLSTYENICEKATTNACAWSDSPNADMATAIWGECIKQIGASMWRQSGDIVFRLVAVREREGSRGKSVSVYQIDSVEILLNGERWDLGRSSRVIWNRDGVFRPGPWWIWISRHMNGCAGRIADAKHRSVDAKKSDEEKMRVFEQSLIDDWIKRHPQD